MQIRARKPAIRRNPRGSCIECFRRKKKCDKDQPCYNCTRRYPPVECIYQKLESLPGDETEPTLPSLATSLDEESAAGAVPSSSDESSLSPEEAEQNPSGDALQLVPQNPISFKIKTLYKVENNYEDSDAEYAQFKARMVIQKFSKLSKLGYSLGCGTLDLLRTLSVEGTSNNADFFDTHNKLMTRYDYSIDGSGKVPELYEKAWIPFIINSPLLLHLNLLKAAIARCQPWLPKTNFERAFLYYSPPSEPCNQAAVIRLRLRAISLLKARIKSPVLSTDDESIAAACYMIYLEWTWNDVTKEFTGLMPHVKGLREMLRQRGGLDKLGQSTVLATVVMLAHYHLATNLECEPFVVPTSLLRDKFTPDHKPRMRGIDSPLWISTGSFAEKLPTSGLHPTTARILDWMSFLTAQIRSSVLNDTSEARYPQIMLSTSRISAHLSSLPSAEAVDEPLHGGGGGSGGAVAGDFIYEAVRLASLVYARAIMRHIKLSQSCSPEALAALLEATSRVPLRKWKEMPGIWLFILLVANAGARFTREGRLSRALMRICSFSIALRDWQAMVNLMESFLAVQKWIGERGREKELLG